MGRYVLEGEWTGYTTAQRRVVHREVITDKRRAERLRNLHVIQYTDGTSLILSLRPATHRERVETIHAYRSLIREAEGTGKSLVRVADLTKPCGSA